MGPFLVGVDLGTSGTRAGVVDGSSGRVLATASVSVHLYYPRPGWVEQEMDEFFSSACQAIRAAMERSGVPAAQIAGLAVGGQMAGVGFVDAHWRPVTRYDSWLDTRCTPQVHQLARQAGDRVLRQTGCPPTNAHGAKLLWWLQEGPDVLRSGVRFLMPSGYVAGKLAGLSGDQAFIDTTYLHFTGLADTAAATWDHELCRELGVPVSLLPRIVEPWDTVGELTAQAAALCGLRPGTPVAAGAGDTAASLLGAGITRPGMAVDVAGTASVLAVTTDRFLPDSAHRTLLACRGAAPGLWHSLAYIAGGGLALRWFRDQLGAAETAAAAGRGEDAYDLLTELAATAPPGAESLLFIPYLGGRVCPAEPEFRGAWVGAASGHTRAHLFRSVLEGIAYEYSLYLRALHALAPELAVQEVRTVGGGARSPIWNQIKADVLGVPYVRLENPELAVVGAAVVAGTAVGLIPDPAAAANRFAQVQGDAFQPDPDRHEQYRRHAARYARLVDILRVYFQEGN